MSENLRLARPFFLLLALFTVGRWALSLQRVPYERGSPVFSLVILTILSSVYYAAFTRRWRGYRVMQAASLAVMLALASQLVIFASTALSYALGAETYFNNPIAVLGPNAPPGPVSAAQALAARAFGLVVNCVLNAIAGALGWALGGLLPETR